MTVRPDDCRDDTCDRARSTVDGPYRPASSDPAPTDGFTTNSPAGGSNADVAKTQDVGTTGTPAADRAARYRLSVFHSTRSAGFTRRGTVRAHATNSSRTGG